MNLQGILAPEILTERLSRRAVQIAQIIGPRKTGKGLNSFIPFSQLGVVGIEMPDETAYMLDLEKGVKSYAMVDLAGRVIPIRDPNGSISFRRASNQNIGKVPIISRSAQNGRIISGKPEWVYPKKDGLYFMQKSIQMSIDEWVRTAKTQDYISMLMQTEAKEDLSIIIYGKPII
jgi:hypothetical protein